MRFELYVLLLFMAIITVTNYRKHIIPDECILALIVFKILYSIFMNTVFELFISIGYALLITVPMLLTLWMEKKTGKMQLGGGDLKLLFAIGLFFSPFETLLILFIGSIVQLVSLKYTRAIMLPLAPALFLSTILVVFFL